MKQNKQKSRITDSFVCFAIKKLANKTAIYLTALKLMSRPLTECVNAPKEMKSTPA